MSVKPAFMKTMLMLTVVSSLCWRIGGVAQDRKCLTPTSAEDPKFKPGQVWSYKTRPGEERSTITILRVESSPKLGMIVHIEGVNLFV
jgi:hypothetical protein